MDYVFIFIAENVFLFSPVIALYFFHKAPGGTKFDIATFAFFSLPLTFILSLVAKELYFNPLPFVVGGFEPLIPQDPSNGFPSDHTLLLAAIASIFTFVYKNKRVALVLWIITLLVGAARMYVGVHHSVDIVGAILIALVSAYTVHAVMLWRKRV